MTTRLRLGPRLSHVSWLAIEVLALAGIFFLPFSKSAAEIGLISALFLWLLRKWPWGEPFPDAAACRLAYPAFLSLALLSAMTGDAGGLPESLAGVCKWFKYFGYFFMSVELFADKRRRTRLFTVFLASATLVCLDGFYQMAAGTDLVKHYSVDIPGRLVRMQGPFSSPNDLAAYLLWAAAFSFFFWAREKKWTLLSGGRLALFALCAVSLVMTLSRSAFIGLAAGAVILAAATQPLPVIFAAAAAPFGLLLSPTLRFNFFSSLNGQDVTIRERLRIWGTTLRMIAEHPLLGTGADTFTDRFTAFSAGTETWRGYAHNCYLQIAAETGIPALILFILPFLWILPKETLGARGRKLPPERMALLAAIPAFLVQSALDTNFFALQASTLFWVFWGVFLGGKTAQPMRAASTRAAVKRGSSKKGRTSASGKISRKRSG